MCLLHLRTLGLCIHKQLIHNHQNKTIEMDLALTHTLCKGTNFLTASKPQTNCYFQTTISEPNFLQLCHHTENEFCFILGY